MVHALATNWDSWWFPGMSEFLNMLAYAFWWEFAIGKQGDGAEPFSASPWGFGTGRVFVAVFAPLSLHHPRRRQHFRLLQFHGGH